MTWRKGIIIFVILFFLFPQLGNAQKQQAYQYKVKVFLVDLQVFITDKEGKFVDGLKPEDFVIIDEGKQQEISHFDYVVHSSNNIDLISRSSPAHRRHFFLLFDLTFATSKGVVNAREAALTFIEKQILPTDLVAVATYSAYQGLKVLVNFTSDKRQLKQVISSLGLLKASHLISDPNGYNFESLIQALESEAQAASGMESAGMRAEADEALAEMFASLKKTDAETYLSIVANFIDQLENLGAALNAIRGKKNIIYFSEGFDGKVLMGSSFKDKDKDTDAFLRGEFHKLDKDRYGDATMRLRMDKMLKKFLGSDCEIQAIDIGGLRAEKAAGRFDEVQRGQTTLFLMAEETGGVLYKNMNDLNRALNDILNATSQYYAIGYYPKEIGDEGKYRKIKVKVNRSGLNVDTRRGYYEDKPYKKYSALEKRIKLAEYISKDIIDNTIEFDALVPVFPGVEILDRVPVFLQFPGKQFLGKKGKKPTNLAIYGYLINDYGYYKDFFNANITINPNKSEKKLESHGIKYFDMLLTTPGNHKVKLIVQNSDTGEIGSKIYYISAPDFKSNELVMTPPIFLDNDMQWILSRGYDPYNPEGKKAGLPVSYPFTIRNGEFIPAVIPEVRVGQPAQFCLKVYNLMLHPEAKVPQTTMDFQIIDQEGKSYKVQKISLANKPTQGEHNCFELVFQFMLEQLPPGKYQFKVTIADNLARQKVQSSSPIILKS